MNAASRSSIETATSLARIEHPSIPMTAVLNGRITVEPTKTDTTNTVRVGFLSDMPMGSSLGEYLDPIILAFEDAVNVTLGLPFIRTSPDHGTAFDIAGTGKADPSSLIAALRLAARMAQTQPA